MKATTLSQGGSQAGSHVGKFGGFIRPVACNQCGAEEFRDIFHKKSEKDETFHIVACLKCALVQVNPQPDLEAVRSYYNDSYFEKRSDRGYDNYYSAAVKKAVCRVYDMNLADLGFFAYEKELFALSKENSVVPQSLDVGCAAGYFVEYMNDRGWNSKGVELSEKAARYGIEQLGLDIIIDDFLDTPSLQPKSLDLLSFWASIEHMHDPRRVLERAYGLLKPGGMLLLSTCRYGHLARFGGVHWRYMNVPEHLYFFSLEGIQELASQIGFETAHAITYGSGLTARAEAGFVYRAAKKIADPLVKKLNMGDMMALRFRRI